MAQQHSPEQLEQALRDFDRTATLIQDQQSRQIWRFDFAGKTYQLNFYPRTSRVFRPRRAGSALSEFLHLQAMQKAMIPVARPVAYLAGFRIGSTKGDALILETIENARRLDVFLQEHDQAGSPVPQRQKIVEQISKIIHDIGAAKLSHDSLTLQCFVIREGQIHLTDARGVSRRGGFREDDLLAFAHDAARFATRTDLLRGWDALNPDTWPPRVNRMSRRIWKRFIRNVRTENGDFGTLSAGEWSGYFTKASRFFAAWSMASRLNVSKSDWNSAWPILLGQLESGQLTPIKQDASGEVFSAEVVLAGRPISVIVKRPKRKFRYRYLIDLFRPARAERMWLKAWTLISRNLPCERPMILMQRKKFGYAMDAVIVFERVPGERLDEVDLDAMETGVRDMLFRRAGRTLRAIERGGLVHYDSKSTNWIVYQDSAHGAIPVMIDVDGIRPMNYWLAAWGVLRLLRAMKNHPQYTAADSLALCRGFAPYARGEIQQEDVSKSAS